MRVNNRRRTSISILVPLTDDGSSSLMSVEKLKEHPDNDYDASKASLVSSSSSPLGSLDFVLPTCANLIEEHIEDIPPAEVCDITQSHAGLVQQRNNALISFDMIGEQKIIPSSSPTMLSSHSFSGRYSFNEVRDSPQTALTLYKKTQAEERECAEEKAEEEIKEERNNVDDSYVEEVFAEEIKEIIVEKIKLVETKSVEFPSEDIKEKVSEEKQIVEGIQGEKISTKVIAPEVTTSDEIKLEEVNTGETTEEFTNVHFFSKCDKESKCVDKANEEGSIITGNKMGCSIKEIEFKSQPSETSLELKSSSPTSEKETKKKKNKKKKKGIRFKMSRSLSSNLSEKSSVSSQSSKLKADSIDAPDKTLDSPSPENVTHQNRDKNTSPPRRSLSKLSPGKVLNFVMQRKLSGTAPTSPSTPPTPPQPSMSRTNSSVSSVKKKQSSKITKTQKVLQNVTMPADKKNGSLNNANLRAVEEFRLKVLYMLSNSEEFADNKKTSGVCGKYNDAIFTENRIAMARSTSAPHPNQKKGPKKTSPRLKLHCVKRGDNEQLVTYSPVSKHSMNVSYMRLSRQVRIGRTRDGHPISVMPTPLRAANLVRIHVYDLIEKDTLMRVPMGCLFPIGKVFRAFNSGLHSLGIGAYHCGIEVNGIEYAYGANDEPGESGVFSCVPKHSPHYTYRTTIDFGMVKSTRKFWLSVPSEKPPRQQCGSNERDVVGIHTDKRNYTHQPLYKREEIDVFVDGFEIMREMARKWYGMDYDLLRKNCCTFARDVCLEMGVDPTDIPSWITNLAETGVVTEDTLATLDESLVVPIKRCLIADYDQPLDMEEQTAEGFEVVTKRRRGSEHGMITVDVEETEARFLTKSIMFDDEREDHSEKDGICMNRSTSWGY